MATADTTTTSTSMALPGLGRALIAANKLDQPTAEALFRKAQTNRTSFIAELTGSGSVSASDLAHVLSSAFGAPLLDLDAVDVLRLPKDLLESKFCAEHRVLVLAKRANRLTIATADPGDQQVAEKIKFASRMGVDWVIAEYDKLLRITDQQMTSVSKAVDNIIGSDFEFEKDLVESVTVESTQKTNSDVEDAPVVKFLQKMLLDAFSMRASLRTHVPRSVQSRWRTP
jgi:type IV pilus assembly protein PilB